MRITLWAFLIILVTGMFSFAEVPPEAKLLFDQSQKAFESGDVEAALVYIKKSIQVDSQFADSHDLYGYILMKKGLYSDAINEFKIALGLNSKMRNSKIGMGLALYKNGNLKEAEVAFQDALKLNPYPASAYYGLGLVNQSLGNDKSANDYFSLAIKTFKAGKN